MLTNGHTAEHKNGLKTDPCINLSLRLPFVDQKILCCMILHD